MSKKKQIGVCRLCGKTRNLTFEHVPPRSAFNHDAVSIIEGDEFINLFGSDRLPWDTEGIKHRIQQQGRGGYYLCESCNNNTGSWYVDDYVKFVRGIHFALQTAESQEPFNIATLKCTGIRPMPLYKAIMTMFCDINNECFGDEKLRNYLLTKESTNLDFENCRVFLYLYDGKVERMSGLAGVMRSDVGFLIMSEIATYPLGMVLYRNCPEGFTPPGVEITDFGTYGYNEIVDVEMGIPKLECNTFFPGDYRPQQMIEDIYSEDDKGN